MDELKALLLAWTLQNNTKALRHAIHDKLIELGFPKVARHHFVLLPHCTPMSCGLIVKATHPTIEGLAAALREEEECGSYSTPAP